MIPDDAGNTPLITVITVVRNGSGLIEQTIRSVLDAGYGNIDYIIVDGGSTDGTVDVIRRYADRLALWTSEPDNGIYDAMNKGWGAARDDSFILFLGAGDRIVSLPENMAGFGQHDVIYGDVELEARLFKGSAGFALRCNNTLHHQALLVPKALHPAPPFDTAFKVYADFDFNQRLQKLGAHFVYSAALRGYALPGGLSSRKAHGETIAIVAKNYGVVWSFVALCFLAARKVARLVAAGKTEAPARGKGTP